VAETADALLAGKKTPTPSHQYWAETDCIKEEKR
jgi:hypothetical protein